MSDAAASPVILLAFANDRDAYLNALQAERAGIYESLQTLVDRGAIQVHKQEETTIEGLFKTLDRYADRIAIVHYAGHADGTALQLEATPETSTETGTETAYAAGLAGRFAQLPALQLVFLNGCATRGQVETLLKAGVRAVIATSVRIDDKMATGFARQFYAALASGSVSIADAFETARNFVATRDPDRRIAPHGSGFAAANENSVLPSGLIWGLYHNECAAAALAWCLPAAAVSPTDILIERINNGSISLAEARRLADALGVDRGAAATSPIPDSATKSFADTVTALATAEDPNDRAAAVSVIRGDDAGAYDQLIASAEADTAKAAERFRQAGALAAPTSVTRAIAAYARAAELDPADFWTWIQLAGLYRRANSLIKSRRCAERALQIAITDRDRGVAESELGEIAAESGDLAEAGRRFFAGLEIRERLAATKPQNSQWQHDLLVSHDRIGDIALATGDLAEARRRFTASQTLIDRLASADPGKRELQGALSIIHNKLGSIATTNGDLTEARRRFTASFEIRERLAATDPNNGGEQRDLSVSHDKLGNIAIASGDLAEARRRFTASLEIRDRLAAIDPDNSGWQRDLSISHEKLGIVASAGGDQPEARRRFTASLEIRERLAAADPHNSQWQRNLAASLIRLGELDSASGDLTESRRRFDAGLEIAERLAAADPRNSQWQHDLGFVRTKLGNLAEAEGDIAAAIYHYRGSLAIIAKLAIQSPDLPERQTNLAYARRRLTKLGADPDAV